jgi:hypothetical protein
MAALRADLDRGLRKLGLEQSSPSCSTRGYDSTVELTRQSVPSKAAAEHQKRMPPSIREGGHHITRYRRLELITYCFKGRLDTLVQEADGPNS